MNTFAQETISGLTGNGIKTHQNQRQHLNEVPKK